MSDEKWLDNNVDHVWHVWLNRYNSPGMMKDDPGLLADRQSCAKLHPIPEGTGMDHSMYEFKRLLQFLNYGHRSIRQALDGTLPQTYKHCSRSPVEEIPEKNVLMCALGQDVTTCPILVSLRKTFADMVQQKYYSTITQDQIDRVQAATCGWHLYVTSLSRTMDLSEGYLMDSTDRMFWGRVYEAMRYPESEDEAE